MFRSVCIAIALTFLATGCASSDGSGLQIGLTRVALDLAFKASGDADVPATAATVPTGIPSQAEFAVTVPVDALRPGAQPPAAAAAPCPTAPKGAVPKDAATLIVPRPPVAGRYALHRTGTFALQTALLNIRGPMPSEGEKVVDNVVTIPGTTNSVSGERSRDQYTFEVIETTGDNFTARTMRVSPTAITLVKQVTKVGETTVTFSPTPAITMMALGSGQGASWNSAGVDSASGTGMVVQGAIVDRRKVDLCGTVYDTYVVRSTERITNLESGYTSYTNDTQNDPSGGGDGLPNTYFVATHHGGLFIQEEFHTTTQLTAGDPPSPVTLKLDYTNTFNAIRPKVR